MGILKCCLTACIWCNILVPYQLKCVGRQNSFDLLLFQLGVFTASANTKNIKYSKNSVDSKLALDFFAAQNCMIPPKRLGFLTGVSHLTSRDHRRDSRSVGTTSGLETVGDFEL